MIFEGLGVARAVEGGSLFPPVSAGASSSEKPPPSYLSSASPLLSSPSVSRPEASEASASRPVKVTKRSFLASAIVE